MRPIFYLVLNLFILHPVIAQDSLITVTAEKGDGIFSLLRRNGLDPSLYYDQFVQLNAELITNDKTLILDKEYQIPFVDAPEKAGVSDNTAHFPIFGNKYAELKVLYNNLDQTVFYLVSGHGGPDPGAVATYKNQLIAEDEYAYDVTLRLGRLLMAHGAKVFFVVVDNNDGIRDEYTLDVDNDEVVYPDHRIPSGQLARLRQRTEVVNRLYLDNLGKHQRLLVIHVDSRSKGQNIDVFFYHHEKSKNGRQLAKHIHQSFVQKYREFQPNRKYTGNFSERSALYMVKNTLPAMAYIEIGNIKSQKDRKRILNPDNRAALAKWIFEGIVNDFKEKRNSSD